LKVPLLRRLACRVSGDGNPDGEPTIAYVAQDRVDEKMRQVLRQPLPAKTIIKKKVLDF
jgi:hypothetical protein